MIRSSTLRAARLVALLLAFGAATLQPGLPAVAAPAAPPGFSAAERAVVARNATLARLAKRAPEAVRKALDAIAKAEGAAAPRGGDLGIAAPPQPFDPARDPDLGRLQRVSPEAASELFQLIKQAGAKPTAPKR